MEFIAGKHFWNWTLLPNEEYSKHAPWKSAFPYHLFIKEDYSRQERLKKKTPNQNAFNSLSLLVTKIYEVGLETPTFHMRLCYYFLGLLWNVNYASSISYFTSNPHIPSY
jgi:hypothetical protein